tara:strand:+ start:726 stop:1130 length:405 start_codon:yes stop_codon:yes gene_type:complete
MDYSRKFLISVLKNVDSIAIVGASSNPERDSYKVMKYLYDNGYNVYPVNPNETDNEILGQKCFSNIKEINTKIDMVDIFRAKEFIMDITKDAINLNVDVIWTQEGLVDKKSAELAKNAGILFIMNECPKKILNN